MLSTLPALKSRLAIPDADLQFDPLLTTALLAISVRFDLETNRTLARTENATFEFDPSDTEILPPCYPLESVSKFELKTNETDGWIEQTGITFLIRRSCIISLLSPLSTPTQPSTALVTYTGGYVLPGDPDPQPQPPGSQPTRLPPDLENAAIEQIAFWFINRDKLGLRIYWPSGAAYQQFAAFDLLPSVTSVLSRHRRLTL